MSKLNLTESDDDDFLTFINKYPALHKIYCTCTVQVQQENKCTVLISAPERIARRGGIGLKQEV